ncbi:MAG: hypothetical protein HZB91_04695 [Elusimicrobia bacterium]|nr:hypothetical protein [Elusimicrobiota bacterium]
MPLNSGPKTSPLTVAVAAAAVAAFAFLLNRYCGFHFFGYDQASIIIDGGWRVYLGQKAFQDFHCPIGPAPSWALAAFFKLFGVSYAAYVGLGCVLNAAAAIAVFWAVWRSDRDLALAGTASAITATWLMPVALGGPTYNSSAYFLVVAAFCLLLDADHPPSETGTIRTLAAGAALAWAFSIKQPVGLFAAVFLGLFSACRAGRSAGILACGFLAGLALLAFALGPEGWLGAWRHLVVLPAHGLSDRIFTAMAARGILEGLSPFSLLPLAAAPFLATTADRIFLLAATLTGFFAAAFSGSPLSQNLPLLGLQHLLMCRAWKRWSASPGSEPWTRALAGNAARAASLPVWGGCVFLCGMGLRYIAMTRWNALWTIPVAAPVVGLAASWAGARLWAGRRFFGERRQQSSTLGIAVVVAGLALLWQGISSTLALRREPAPAAGSGGPVRTSTLAAPFFNGLRLPLAEAQSMDRLYLYLAALPENKRPFFLYNEVSETVFYAALGQAPPQPFIGADPGLTYQGPEDEALLCSALERADVRTVGAYGGVPGPGYGTGPECMKRWLREGFVDDRTIDEWVFYSRRTGLRR